MASIPTAPEPAQRSRNRTPAMRGAITLKRVSRRRSEVGRTSSEGGLFRFRPRNFPAMIRNTDSRFEQKHQSTDYADYTEQNGRNASLDSRESRRNIGLHYFLSLQSVT